jgi:hypothetical protein
MGTYATNCLFGATSEIRFLHRDKTYKSTTDAETKEVMTIAGQMLTRLRHLSGQAKAPQVRHLAILALDDIESIPALEIDRGIPGTRGKVSRYLYGTSITCEHIETACRTKDAEPEIFETLLLDAVSAYWANDFRTSILYAAMSMEVALGATIDAEYERVTAGLAVDPRVRVIRLPIAGGGFAVKDPIYERLKENTHFPVKLHELPLYILGKSLLVDDQTLHLHAKTLYTTRNTLVHSGVVEDTASANVLSLGPDGAFKALDTAQKVLRWLNINTAVQLPVLEFVSASEIL